MIAANIRSSSKALTWKSPGRDFSLKVNAEDLATQLMTSSSVNANLQ
jgi:hypothetical protein